MGESRKLVVACVSVIRELRPFLTPDVAVRVLDFGHHNDPNSLREALQRAVDEYVPKVGTIVLAYGLCSQAVIGVKSNQAKLIVPRVDDCIAILLGSRLAYLEQCRAEPGTYFLTKGWIEAGYGPFFDYDRLAARRGREYADRTMRIMLANCKRLALIDAGQHDMAPYRQYAEQTAARFGLCYEEIAGSGELVKKMIHGPWDDDFVLLPPGETVKYEHFYGKTWKC